MKSWIQRTAGPAGAMPKGLVAKIAIALGTVVAVAVILTSPGSDEEAAAEAAPGQAAEAVSGEGLVQSAASAVQRLQEQAARMRAAEDAEMRARQRRAAEDAAGGGLRAYVTEDGEVLEETPEDQLREELRLSEIRRAHEALRSPMVALSRRVQEEPAEGPPGQAGAPAGTGGAPAAAAAAAGTAAPGELAELEALSSAAGVPEPADAQPTPVTRPEDPQGWERIYEGQVLEAVMATELQGEHEGPAVALVSAPLWSRDRQRVLVPRGTRAIGRAEAVGNWGQARLAVPFHRLVFPDGSYIRLEFEGLDQAGATGLRDRVNRHYLATIGAAGAVGLIAGLTLRGSRPYEGGIEGARAGGAIGLGQSAQTIMERYLNRMPTITIRAGTRARIMLTSDALVPRPAFEPWLAGEQGRTP